MFVFQTGAQQQCWSGYGTSRHNNRLRVNGDTVGFARFHVRHGRFDPYRFAVLNQYLISVATHDNSRTMIKGVLQIRFHGGLLGTIATAEAASPTTLLAVNGVATQFSGMI